MSLLEANLGRLFRGWLRSPLFGVSPTDPPTYAAVSAGLAALALLAGYRPARRASRADPVDALRSDGA